MLSLIILIPILCFVTVLLIIMALAPPNETTIQKRLGVYGRDPSRRPGGDLSMPFASRVLLPAIRRAVGLVTKLTPTGIITSSQTRLRQANSRLGLGTFLLLRLVAAAILPAINVLPAIVGGDQLTLQTWAITILLLFVGYKLPDVWLGFKIDARRELITRSLPDALDLIVVCVEAGYSLEAALAKVVERTKGPLAEEFDQTLREVSLGRTRREALHDLSDRCGSPDLQTFIAAILQADQMGVSIADALRVQSDAMRVRRRQRAEELIAKAPVKMLFPMAGFIFPALFVVLLGPAGIHILSVFSVLGQ